MKQADIIILSPHLDDAALSVGDHIRAWRDSGRSVSIVTVFTRFSGVVSSDVRRFSGIGDMTPAAFGRMRRLEDARAMKLMGASGRHLGYTDGAFRSYGGRLVYPDFASLFSGVLSREDSVIRKALTSDLKPFSAAGLIIVPLGVGRHADHLLVRSVAEAVFTGGRTRYYVDYPYALHPANWSGELLWRVLARGVSRMPFSRQKAELLASYRSQMPLLFPSPRRYPEIIVR